MAGREPSSDVSVKEVPHARGSHASAKNGAEKGSGLERGEALQRPIASFAYLVWLCIQRQRRSHQLLWIAIALLVLSATIVVLNTLGGRWGMDHWRFPRGGGPSFATWSGIFQTLPLGPGENAAPTAIGGAIQAALSQTGFYVFANTIILGAFLSFLLPIWSLSFATNAIGGEREAGTLVWLLSRPLPRPAIYLAKYIGILPFSVGLNLGGFAILCLLAGRAGQPALRLLWPAVVLGTLAFCSLFHLIGACFRRAAVISLVYAFFLEAILGNMPGYMKRISIGFYARCLMFDEAGSYSIAAEKPSVYLPVDGTAAIWLLTLVTIICLVVGMVVFSRTEYREAV